MPGTDDRPAACRMVVATAPAPGAIAILHLAGDVAPVLEAVTGVTRWPTGRARLVELGGVDQGLAVRLGDRVAQLMPHGGPRVVQRLAAVLEDLGVEVSTGAGAPPPDLYPEASDPVEALALAAVARAPSPLAVDLLLDQPRRWRAGGPLTDEDRRRSARLRRLLQPPVVVLAGPPNAGKSTLSNALFGRSISIAAAEPGTTRDYTGGRLDLAGLVVSWHDTPGLRTTDDELERRAVELAARLLRRADLVVALAGPEQPWPNLGRRPDLRVAGHADRARRNDADLAVSGTTGEGLEALVATVRDRLVPPTDLRHPGRWIFDDRLEPAPADADRAPRQRPIMP